MILVGHDDSTINIVIVVIIITIINNWTKELIIVYTWLVATQKFLFNCTSSVKMRQNTRFQIQNLFPIFPPQTLIRLGRVHLSHSPFRIVHTALCWTW